MDLNSYVDKHLARGQLAADHAKVMLLTCIDFRYPHRIADVMDRWGLRGKYDQFVLAGASLGALQPSWRALFVQHVNLALDLGHVIDRIVILDHRDCGAYKSPQLINPPLPKDVLPSIELATHKAKVTELVPLLKKDLSARIPHLVIDSLLLTRDEDDEIHYESGTGPAV